MGTFSRVDAGGTIPSYTYVKNESKSKVGELREGGGGECVIDGQFAPMPHLVPDTPRCLL